MKLTFCIIIKDDKELPKLKKLMASVDGVFDCVCITANHKPYKKIEKYCKDNNYDFTFLEWNDDFSAQRNYNFSQAPDDTDYIVWADTDDVIVNAYLLRDIAHVAKKKGYDTLFFEYWYGAKFDGEPDLDTFVETELMQTRERMIKPGSVVWKKRIHETPVPLDPPTFVYSRVPHDDTYPIAWLHLGADRDISQTILDKRLDRNKRLLELELADERSKGEADPRTILYLMKIYAESDDEATLKECIQLGEEYIEKSGWDQERALCYMLMSKCIGMLGDHRGAIDLLHGAVKEFPYNPMLYLYMARAYFNTGNYRAMKHWMDVGMGMDIDSKDGSMNHILELKVLSAELLLEYNLHGKRDIRRAYQAAKILNKVNPSKNNQHNENFLKDQADLDEASENVHKFMNYLKDKHEESLIPLVVKAMPEEMRRLPFAYKYYNRYKPQRMWEDNEICYFANFGQNHFEKWDGNSLQEGIGGSETAVIRLAEEWTKLGYKVVVYGDPVEPITVNGVLYLPFWMFNKRDYFNIFIQWRHSSMADQIITKKFFVDLHDIYSPNTHTSRLDQIDSFMVKSEYHARIGDGIPKEKFSVISNGI